MKTTPDGNNHNGVIPESCFEYYANDNIPCSKKCENWEEKLVPIFNYGSWKSDGSNSDIERINYLLAKLKDVPGDKRTARFRCVIAIASPDREVESCSGECLGFISTEPRGHNGFGYDPIFYLPEFGKTMAELSIEQKNQISHRAQAAEKARIILMKR